MASKKDDNLVNNEKEKSQNDDISPLELNNLEKRDIESQKLEVSKGHDNDNGFLDFINCRNLLQHLSTNI